MRLMIDGRISVTDELANVAANMDVMVGGVLCSAF